MLDGRYELIEQVGVGGMASVWRASDTALGREVAIKRLLPHLAANEAASERFRREARSAAMLNHPGIVTVFDSGQDDDGPYIVMEFIGGQTVAQKLDEEGPLDLPTVAGLVKGAAAALDYAHSKGVVHRDIKPSNLIVEEDGQIRLADFGIARNIEDATTLTEEGDVVGTLAYVAPEVLEGHAITPRADVYGLAAVAFEMLSGEPPFRNDSVGGLIGAIQRESPSSIDNVPDGVNAALATALSKRPEERPASAGEFASRLLSNTTLPMATPTTAQPGSRSQSRVDSPPPGAGDPTLVLSRIESRGVEVRRRWWVWAALSVLVIGVLGALISFSGGRNPDLPREKIPANTTTSTSTSTTVTTTTTLPTTEAATPENIVIEIRETLTSMEPPGFKPKDVRRVEDRLDDIVKDWSDEKLDRLSDKFDRAFESIEDLPESPKTDLLFEQFIELADVMGIEVNRGDD